MGLRSPRVLRPTPNHRGGTCLDLGMTSRNLNPDESRLAGRLAAGGLSYSQTGF